MKHLKQLGKELSKSEQVKLLGGFPDPPIDESCMNDDGDFVICDEDPD